MPDSVMTGHEYRLAFNDDESFEKFDDVFKSGNTDGAWLIDLTTGDTLFTPETDYTGSAFEEKFIHGFKLTIDNDDSVKVNWAGWVKGRSNVAGDPRGWDQQTLAVPRDYEIRVGEMGIDSSYSAVPGRARHTNFTVLDITDADNPQAVVFGLGENAEDPDSLLGVLSHGDEISVKAAPLKLVFGSDTTFIYTENTWRILFNLPRGVEQENQILPKAGDIFRFTTKKPFNRHDVFEFKMIGGDYKNARAANSMDNIYTVPDPYIAASTLEPRLVNQDIGRGERRIDFVNLPKECTISIFTASGRLVRELNHFSADEVGREAWDLRTVDGLEVAHGIYIYHVDAPDVGTKIGKLAIIK